jgi:DNA repair photolyase
MFSMNMRSDLNLLQITRDACAGAVWTVTPDARGEAQCAFCAVRARRIGPPAATEDADTLVRALSDELGRRGRRGLKWVWLSPLADPWVPAAAEELGFSALRLAEELLGRGVGVVVRTRGGLSEARGLVALARRYGELLRVEIGFFSSDAEQIAAWERGAATLAARLELGAALAGAGAQVRGRVGPLVPLVNDGEAQLRILMRELARHGIREVTPHWIEDGLGLVRQVEREVSRSRARMLEGWFRLDRAGTAIGRRRLPESVRDHAMRRLMPAAAAARVEVRVCRCTAGTSAHTCLDAPRGLEVRGQLELFGGRAG